MPAERSSFGVLLMAYGTPRSPENVLEYYTHIRRGRAPSAEQLSELQGRYEAIGGLSPLLEITRAQASGLSDLLSERSGTFTPVALGMKHAEPFIESGLERLLAEGVKQAVALVLAPLYSRMSTGEYFQRVRAAADAPIEITYVDCWHLSPAYTALLAARLGAALAQIPEPARAGTEVVFTAHSLPERALQNGDPYADQLRQTAEAVAERLQLTRWSVAWQSAGRTEDAWLGPDILDVIEALARDGRPGVAVCPAGFVSNHLEILYDLDIAAADLARERSIAFARSAMPNADPDFLECLAQVVLEHAPSAGAA